MMPPTQFKYRDSCARNGKQGSTQLHHCTTAPLLREYASRGCPVNVCQHWTSISAEASNPADVAAARQRLAEDVLVRTLTSCLLKVVLSFYIF